MQASTPISSNSGRDFKKDVAGLVSALKALRAQAADARFRKREDERLRLEKERTDREQLARLEALRGVEVDSLALLLGETSRKRFGAVLALVVGAFAIAGIVAALVWADANRDARRRNRAERYEREKLQQQLNTLQNELNAQDDQRARLTAELQNAHDEAERAKIQRALDAADNERKKIVAKGGSLKERFVGGPVNCRCPPGDPLCSCL